MSIQKRTIALDFDGVLHQYNGYRNGYIDKPIPGALEAVEKLVQSKQTVVVFTTRNKEIVKDWLKEHKFPGLEVTDIKRPFYIIVDDRGYNFSGKWDDLTIKEIMTFEPYWLKQRKDNA